MHDPTLSEMLDYLTSYSIEIEPFEQHEAKYCVAHDYHGGQWSNLYSALCTSPFNPGPLSTGCEPDSMAAMLYEELETHFGETNV